MAEATDRSDAAVEDQLLDTAERRGFRDILPQLAYDWVVNAEELDDDRLRVFVASSRVSNFVVDVADRGGWSVDEIDFEQSAIVFVEREGGSACGS